MAKTERIEFRVSPEFLARIDEAREDVSRSRWIERAIEHRLEVFAGRVELRAEIEGLRAAHQRGEPVVVSEPYKLPPSKPSPKPAVPPSRASSRVAQSVPGVRPAREFVLDPRQAALNKAKKA